MEKDIEIKRAIFIDNCQNLNNEFETLSPSCQLRLFRIYNTHFTGSCLWDFSGQMINKLWNSYNVNLRIIFDLPFDTHSFIVEELSGGKHAKQMMYSRYMKFMNSLSKNKRKSLQFLQNVVKNDVNSVTGSNLRKILLDTGHSIIPGVTKKMSLDNYKVYKIPEEEQWRIPLIESLLEVKAGNWAIEFDEEEDNFNGNAIKLMLDRACSN